MSAHPHSHGGSHTRRAWGEPRPGPVARVVGWVRAALSRPTATPRSGLPDLPVALRRAELADQYLETAGAGDHRRAGATAATASERAIEVEDWWPADVWAHRALWHFEQAQMTLAATRQARRIGDLRTRAGDPASARRYYAEAIDEARDIGAEHEQGLAALGMGRAHLDLGEVTPARRLAAAAADLLERAGAPAAELDAARGLLGTEVAVGEGAEEH